MGSRNGSDKASQVVMEQRSGALGWTEPPARPANDNARLTGGAKESVLADLLRGLIEIRERELEGLRRQLWSELALTAAGVGN